MIVATLGFVLLNHVDLLLEGDASSLRLDDPEMTIENEFPNPFLEIGLARGWEGGHARVLLGIHLAGTLAAGFLLLRMLGSWPTALAGAALYGVHPAHAALLAEGIDFAVLLAPPAGFLGCLLLWGAGRVRPLGALLLAAAAACDPAALMLPVFLLALRWLAPEFAPPRAALPWAGAGALTGLGVAIGLGLRAWPRLPLEAAFLPPGPPAASPVHAALLTLGRALRHLYTPAFPGVDYGRGEVSLAWTWADAGAIWFVAAAGAAALLLAAARLAPRGHRSRPLFGAAAAAAMAALLLPLPGLVASLHTAEGFVAGQLLTTTLVPALLLALAVLWVLGPRRPVAAVRRIAAVALALGVVLPASLATFRWNVRLKTEDSALRAALEASDRSYRLRRRFQEMRLRLDHNKFDLKQHFEALARERPEDARIWAALGRFHWVIRRFDEAVAAFENALSREPGNRRLRYQLAAAQLLARRSRNALDTLEELPEVPEVRTLRMLARARSGLEVTAPDAADAPLIVLRAWGMVLAEAGRFAAGLAVLERVRAARPKDALAAAYHGWCLLGVGRVDEAEEVLRFDALRAPSGFFAHKLLGDLYLEEGPRYNRGEAYHHYSYFVKHDRGHPDTERILEILQAMQQGER
ncbi:MAG: tetratricopeptide repeat protein [Planctomycetes bacterium]|nr:tetratricopeptide repeat protein [Planctomycetota bacterium]